MGFNGLIGQGEEESVHTTHISRFLKERMRETKENERGRERMEGEEEVVLWAAEL